MPGGRRGFGFGGEQAQLASRTGWGRTDTAFGSHQTWVRIPAPSSVCSGRGSQRPWTSVSSGVILWILLQGVRHVRLNVPRCSRPLGVPSLGAPVDVIGDGSAPIWPPFWHPDYPGNRSALCVSPSTSRPVRLYFLAHLASLRALPQPRGQGRSRWATRFCLPRAHLLVWATSQVHAHRVALTGRGGWSCLVTGGLDWARQGAVLPRRVEG